MSRFWEWVDRSTVLTRVTILLFSYTHLDMGNESCFPGHLLLFLSKKIKKEKEKKRDKIVASEYQQWCDFQDLS
jgi:hypothetical protein